MVDPVAGGRRALPGKLEDLMITASNAWVLSLDNVTRVSEAQSNALCALSTGGGYPVR
jgi:hypothetical protein